MGESTEPQVLVPYPGPQGDGTIQDVFVYLRPETNGVLVESVLLKVVQARPPKMEDIKLVYLANFPGEYIVANHIIERHYAHKFFFAVHGKNALTERMTHEFERRFHIPLAEADVIGSFEALGELGMDPEQLFSHWVASDDVLSVEGQTIKRINDRFVVNYDMPAILHKNNRGTDIAVMMFRSGEETDDFSELAAMMREALVEKGILPADLPAQRVFHYSKGPFEQLLDATDYLLTPEGDPVPPSELSFVRYAMERGYTPEELLRAVESPICSFELPNGETREENLLAYTMNDTYDEALAKYESIRSQLWIR